MTTLPPASVLVVDDSLEVRRLARRVLEPAGYRVREAADGFGAMRLIEHDGPFSLILADIRMPNMDGWELATSVRGQIPVLFMSGYAAHIGSTSLPGPIIAKPFAPDVLVRRVRELLSKALVREVHDQITTRLPG